MIVGHVFAALLASAVAFVSVLWTTGIYAALIAAFVTANVTVVAVGLVAATRRASGPALDRDRRSSDRTRTFRRGRVQWDGAQSHCIIEDLSATGARLKIRTDLDVPNILDLYIEEESRTARANVRWRAGDEIGIEFVVSEPSAGADDLAAENANLRAEVLRLRSILDARWATSERKRG